MLKLFGATRCGWFWCLCFACARERAFLSRVVLSEFVRSGDDELQLGS